MTPRHLSKIYSGGAIMLNQKDIDDIMLKLQAGERAYLYYAAGKTELKGITDSQEFSHKDEPRYIPIKVEVTNIQNAFFEYLKYKNNPDMFKIEEEEVWYDPNTKYIHRYISPIVDEFSAEFNSRTPSAIYGVRRDVYKKGILIKSYTDPTPVKEVYTNAIEYGDLSNAEVLEKIDDGSLSWKYMKLEDGEVVDGLRFNYVTSNWYILTISNWAKVEKPLINIKDKCAFFTSVRDAYYAIDQLEA